MVVQSIGLVTDLRNQNKNIGVLYIATGLVTAGDNNGGVFWWNPSSTAADDGVDVIQVTGTAVGRWVRITDNNNSVPSSRELTINGVTYDLSANRTWSISLDSVTDVSATTTNSITVGSLYLTGMTAGSGALYYTGTRLTLANYNAGGTVYVEVNGGAYAAVFGADLSFTSNGTIGGVFNQAVTDTDKFLVSDGGVIKYRTGAELLSDIGGQPSGNYVPESRTLTINGTTYDLSANRTWSVGTVTSVSALTIGTSGTDLSSTVATGTTTPVITLNVPTASATNRGALSSADWTTFNSKVGGTGVAGQVAYWSGTNTQTGSNNLFWDTANNRLGVGLINPQRALEVYSATPDSHLRLSGSAPSVSMGDSIVGGLYQAKFGLATANGQYASASVAGDFVILSQTGATIFMTSATEKMRITAAGRMLLGTTTEGTFLLDVNGTTRLNGVTTIGTINQATTDTDRFLVSDAGVVKYRTGAELLSDIGAQPSGNYVPESRTLTINGTTYDLSANRTWSVGTVTGTGTTNVLPKWTSSSALGNSIIDDDGTSASVALALGGAFNIKYLSAIKLALTGGTTFGSIDVPVGLDFLIRPDSIEKLKLSSTGLLRLAQYGTGSVTGTPTYRLATDASGNIIEVSDGGGTVTSVGLSMPSAFTVTNSPVTGAGTLTVTGAGTSAQYVRGDGQLANFPSTSGGGSSVNYYLNGSVNQGTFGGDTYYEMSKSPIAGAGTNFTRTSAQGNGYIASFITDANDPSLLVIPGGNWNLEFYFNASSGGGTPSFYAELYKVSSSNVFTLIASGSTNPEGITQGTVIDQYFTSIPVPQTSLLATDRIAVRIFVAPDGRNITLHTEDNNLCEVLTTFSTGLNALNGLTAQVQYFATGTSGTDFAISSATDTHTFNLPIASGTNTGKLSNTDWTTFINKQSAITLTTFNASGSATFVSSVLNIPTYTLVGLGGEPAITPGASTQYFRGDKTFQTLDTSVVPENSNLYYTDTRARNAITLTTTGSSGASTYSGGTLNVPIYSLSGLGGVPTTRTLTINGTTYDLSADRSWTIPVHDAVTIGTANGLSLSTQVLSLGLSSSSANGALSSTDWSTFNGKQNAITLTTTGSSGSATFISNTLNVPTYTLAGLGGQPQLNGTGFVKISGTTISYDNSTYYLASNPSAYIALTALTASAPLSYNNTTGAFTISQASGSVNGFLSSTDWTTFNNKQNALTNPVTGTGTTNYLPKWTSGSVIGNSLVFDNGTNVGIGTTSPSARLHLLGAFPELRLEGNNDISGSGYVSFYRPTSGIDGYIQSGASGLSIVATTNLTFRAGGSERGRFSSGGNLLVNSTTDNGNRLQVTGNISATNTNGRLTLSNGNTASGSKIQSFNAAGNGNGYLAFEGYTIEYGRFDTSGNLGLGTANPDGNLVVAAGTNGTASTGGYIGLTTGVNNSKVRGAAIEAFTTDTSNNHGLRFYTNAGATTPSVRMILDASGNLGLGVQPSAWDAGIKAFEIFSSGNAIVSSTSSQNIITTNARYVGGGWQYGSNGLASTYQQQSGVHTWNLAPSGTAGNAITFTQAMTLTSGGNLLVGTTSDSGNKLQVNGSALFTEFITLRTGTNGYNGEITLGSNSANRGRIYYDGDINGQLIFQNSYDSTNTNSGILFQTRTAGTAVNALTIAGSGAATFSSSVTAGGGVVTTGANGFRDTDGTINAGFYAAYTAGLAGIGTLSNHSFSIFTNGVNERARFTAGGNLLVGTTTDSGEKLQVSGSAKVSSSADDYVGLSLLNTNNNASLATSTAIKLGFTSTVGTHYGTFKIKESSNNDNTADFTLSLPYAGVESTKLTIFSTGDAELTGTIKTAAPTGYSAQPWKLGDATSGTLTPNYYIKVEINGQIYSIPALQGTP